MMDTTKMTRGNQMWYMIKREIICVCIFAFVQFLLFLSSYTNVIFRNVSGVLFIVAHFYAIYDGAAALAKLDKKSYTPLKYDIKWSLCWGAVIAAISLVFMIVFKLNWHFGAADGTLKNPISIIINIIFYLWQSPYMAFIIMTKKTVHIAVVITSFVLPIIASLTGYVTSKYDFGLKKKLHGMMFEKDGNDT